MARRTQFLPPYVRPRRRRGSVWFPETVIDPFEPQTNLLKYLSQSPGGYGYSRLTRAWRSLSHGRQIEKVCYFPGDFSHMRWFLSSSPQLGYNFEILRGFFCTLCCYFSIKVIEELSSNLSSDQYCTAFKVPYYHRAAWLLGRGVLVSI